jgi:hypothetical protein
MIAFNNLAGIVTLSVLLMGALGSASPAPSPQNSLESCFKSLNPAACFNEFLPKREGLEAETLEALQGRAEGEAEFFSPGTLDRMRKIVAAMKNKAKTESQASGDA